MRRGLWALIVLIVAALAAGGYYALARSVAGPPILVGLLHSRTGPNAASEKALIDAEILALEEINAEGGLLGRPVMWVVADGRSRDAVFAEQAQRLITIDKVGVIFGGYSSGSRKSMKPVVEENHHLLIYPAAYEGVEGSSNIVYTGGPANQQVAPAVSWCVETLKARKLFLVGTDAIWSRVVSALTRDVVKARGAQVVGEECLPPESDEVSAAIEAIKKSTPDAVINTLEGIEANAAFYTQLRQAGFTPDRLPVVSFNISEEELRTLPVKDLVGHYSAWNYFQSVERPENERFVRKFKARYGADRVTCDGVATAYNSVRLWAGAVDQAQTEKVAEVLAALPRQSLDAAEGIVTVDPVNLNNWRPFFMGKVRPDGQFEVVFTISKPIPPYPYPRIRPRAEWEALIADLSKRWGGHWAKPPGS